MYIDVILELSSKQIRYVRVFRALRSLFLIDNYLLSGVRRYVYIIVSCIVHIINHDHDGA